MKKDKENVLSTSALLENVASSHPRDKISIGEIKDSFHERGFGLLFLVFSLPLLIPIPVPIGLGVVLCVPLTFFAFQFTINADSPWLPKWVMSKEISIAAFRKVISKSLPSLRFVEKFLKKRTLAVSDSRRAEIFVGIFIMLLQIPILLPIPFSNNIPAAAICLIALGMLEKDGLVMILGSIVGVIAWAIFIFFISIIIYGSNKIYEKVPVQFRDEFHELAPVIKQLPDDISVGD